MQIRREPRSGSGAIRCMGSLLVSGHKHTREAEEKTGGLRTSPRRSRPQFRLKAPRSVGAEAMTRRCWLFTLSPNRGSSDDSGVTTATLRMRPGSHQLPCSSAGPILILILQKRKLSLRLVRGPCSRRQLRGPESKCPVLLPDFVCACYRGLIPCPLFSRQVSPGRSATVLGVVVLPQPLQQGSPGPGKKAGRRRRHMAALIRGRAISERHAVATVSQGRSCASLAQDRSPSTIAGEGTGRGPGLHAARSSPQSPPTPFPRGGG
ncbi:PREDICTED: uncharacterized protein LOC106150110 [Chinchilla lanigera]|uniref:uncharacterized protein LOC106150110 n=1 Tax=Chinchilla lanigera TaxID=34839 RepID=UPI0006971579|nr:PREDICTED: uncharacterized protein LOC106150110 [Chinchilla lanigera]